jgi:AraC-like DNA-binding protein
VLAHRLERGHIEIIGRPAHARLYRDYFHVEVRFDAEQDALCLPLELLDRRSPLADADMYESSIRRLEQLAERLSGPRFVAARVTDLIASSSDSGLPMEATAKLLAVSPRTLMRRLHDSGTSYRELRDGHRRRRAHTLLETTTLTMAEIAARLGYEDPSNFARACHRWFECAPGAVRERLGGSKAGDAATASDFPERADALGQRRKSSVTAKRGPRSGPSSGR